MQASTANINAIREIALPSRREHKYCLCLIDQNSKLPEVVPLKNLYAKKTCGTFLENFMHTGIPRVICSNNQGTNFKSQLTQEFRNRLGTWPTSQLQHIWCQMAPLKNLIVCLNKYYTM